MINKIRERLSKITPPPWYIEHTIAAPEIGNGERKIAKALYYGGSEDNEVDANADFIANAPDDIAFLLGEVETKDKHIAELEEKLGIRSSINAMTDIAENDHVVYKGKKAFIVNLFTCEDLREKVDFTADCIHFQTDSYGVEGSEFYCCGCEDKFICKYAGSEFKYWDETDPDPIEIGCRIRFTDRDLGKTVFLTEEEAQQALEDGK